jgi:FAD/FMN-containing dehydrogenase
VTPSRVQQPLSDDVDLFLDSLRDIVGPAHVLTDPAALRGYITDWTGRWEGAALAVVRPGNTEEVVAVLALCHRANVPIVPQGGNTGLVGGSIPSHGSVVLSTRRLNRIEAIDRIERTISAGAGVTVASADRAAAAHGLRFAIELASNDSATLGGIVATNAGGARMIRYGDARSQLLGIEAVLADGSILRRWSPLIKDNVGYDLPGLLAGSEGTLAVITKVLMKLATPASQTQVVVAGVATVDAALQLCDRVRRAGLTLEAAELMTAAGIDLVCRHADGQRPFAVSSPIYALIEVFAHRDAEAALLEILSVSGDLVDDAVIEPGPARKLWGLREDHTESIGRESTTPVIKLDVSVPLASMNSFVAALTTKLAVEFPTATSILFGHFADGNIHVNIANAPVTLADAITDTVFRMVTKYGGSISAEHGVGRAKTRWIHLSRTADDLRTMIRIKAALDPRHLLNPEVLLPPDCRQFS